VNLTKKDIKAELERAISSTHMHQNRGTCTSIKIGVISQTPQQILSNLVTALPAVVSNIKDNWDNVQSFHIKTSGSVSLPIWTCELGTGETARWSAAVNDIDEVATVHENSPIIETPPAKKRKPPTSDADPLEKSKKTKASLPASISSAPVEQPPQKLARPQAKLSTLPSKLEMKVKRQDLTSIKKDKVIKSKGRTMGRGPKGSLVGVA
jgi:ribosome biogenesis protein UTP30